MSTALVKFPRRESGFMLSEEQKLSRMSFSPGPSSQFAMIAADQLLPATKVDYAKEVGDGLRSSVLMAPLNWLMRTFPEAPPIVERKSGDTWRVDDGNALTMLLRRPNPYYGGIQLAMATVLDLSFGNGFWLKIRNANDEVVELWWVPRMLMNPRWAFDGTTFIDYYEYYATGQTFKIPVKDVVHFRFGMDPNNMRLGLSPLGSLVRDVAMDDHAANFATAILRNLGVIGVVISPESGTAGNPKALEETKQKVRESFSGDRRGDPLTLSSPTKVQLLQYQMQGFDVSPLRDVSEERVCAALGIPAAVVGFGTGLQQTKVGATMKEMRQLAWTGGLIPMQSIISEEIDRSLLNESIFAGNSSYSPPSNQARIRMRYDTSQVRALWEDTADKHNRVRADYLAGMISKGEARRETGRATTPDDDKHFIQPVNVQQLGDDGKPMATAPAGSPTSTTPTASPATDSNSEE